jgi:hypothetical protein
MIATTASVAVTANRVAMAGADLTVTVTRRKVAAGVRVRITAVRHLGRGRTVTQSDYVDFASAEEAARVFDAQCVRWHTYTQANAIKEGYAQAA